MKVLRSMVLVSVDDLSLERGAQDIFRALLDEIDAYGLSDQIAVTTIRDAGIQADAPVVIVYPDAAVYGSVTVADVHTIVEEHLFKGNIVPSLLAMMHEAAPAISWMRGRRGALPVQNRIVLERAGMIDPESIEDYILHDGFQALGKAVTQMAPAEVIAEVDRSGLQGRGGAGFPTGQKWRFVASTPGSPKYVICNADESEPGTFKDRLILEGDPFSVIEAMTIAGYAVNAHEGYIYIRGEYPLAYQRVDKAIHLAKDYGLLGDHVFGTDFSFHIHPHAGAGAYICGEETALIESLEGKRGMPRARPPYPTTVGLFGQPTVVNNVETLANVPPILRNGAVWYREIGSPKSAGTKIYTVLGNVNFTGAIEVPMGITLREVIDIYAKGMKNDKQLKLVQTGGSSGTLVPASLQDVPLDFESFRNAGVSLGSGALLVCDEDTCVVDLAKSILRFFRNECCGKCTPCRIGTLRLYELMNQVSEGRASLSDLDLMLTISEAMSEVSNCGLGQTASISLRDCIKYFREEIESHIVDRVCPAAVCPVSDLAPAAEPVG
jgi:NADH:ubiquinone oxidoreductase subunit F (NADH-binding)/(2Fe-2S) ferredoxin